MSFPEKPLGRDSAGFSLIELAIAIFVMGLLLGGLLIPLRAQVEIRRFQDTEAILEQARETLLGFVAARGYFPCPATATSNGQEAVDNHSTGADPCLSANVEGIGVFAGFFPAATLGFAPVDENGYARDAWATVQNRLRYAVAEADIGAADETATRLNGMRIATMDAILNTNAFIRICRTGTGVAAGSATDCAAPGDRLANNAIAVIWSLGPNAPTGGTSVQENKNFRSTLTSYSRVFVKTDFASSGTNTFDDQLTWISPAMLFNRMIAAGTLP